MNNRNKGEELKWLLAFQERCSECPCSKPEQLEPPAPDIIFPECGLGIEITEYSLGQGKQGSFPRQFEIVSQRITSAAKAKYEESKKTSLQVTILWTNFRECPTNREEKRVADAIAQLVTTNTTTRIGNKFVDWGPSGDELLQKYGVQVNIYPIEGGGPSCWSSAACFCFPEEAARIQVALDAKEPKVSGYRESCRELWLLIIADKRFFSSEFSPNTSLGQIKFLTSFDRVFLLETVSNSIYEFATEKQPK